MSGPQQAGDVSVIAGATRMLLTSDGSTTVLLEALLDCSLSVQVDRQEFVPVPRLASAAVTALGLVPGGTAVERASTLRTSTGATVSRNLVVFTAPPAGWSGSAEDLAPLGKRLREQRTRQHREVLSSGRAQWHDGVHSRPCAYKEYVITCDDGGKLYVHERFSPDHVRPPVDHRPDRSKVPQVAARRAYLPTTG
ncbi:hypothetical protein [Streptomyces sp. CT34]|uniref:hypothetical protein n=1 Tax=Streptomyces sp. CT34 TaxID=1553907 RepID=UPI00068B0908|nr:hypothetical protein [Streptomyces sp. CT34]